MQPGFSMLLLDTSMSAAQILRVEPDNAAPNATHLLKIAGEVVTGKRSGMVINGDDYDTPDGTCVRGLYPCIRSG